MSKFYFYFLKVYVSEKEILDGINEGNYRGI